MIYINFDWQNGIDTTNPIILVVDTYSKMIEYDKIIVAHKN